MCDTMAAVAGATETGGTLFAKNSDRDHTEAQYLELFPARRHAAGEKLRLTYVEIDQASETHAVLLSKPHWIWGAEIGANSHGLTIGNEAIFAKLEASLEPGVIGMDYVRLALERAGEVDEAIHVITSLLRRYGQGGNCGFRRTLGYHNSYMIADRNGAKVLETVDREWVVLPVTTSCAISNAVKVETSFSTSSDTLQTRAIESGLYQPGASFSFRSVFEDPAKSARGRYRHDRATQLLTENVGGIRVSDLFRILRDHVEGPVIDGRPGSRICAHQHENPIGQTTASWVSDLMPGKTIHWVTGTAAACTGIFKPLMLEVPVPDHGPHPGAHPDSNSLWWRHEQLRQSRESWSAVQTRDFDEQRQALESRFLDVMRACPPPADVRSRDDARTRIEKCWQEALAFESQWLGQAQRDRAQAS